MQTTLSTLFALVITTTMLVSCRKEPGSGQVDTPPLKHVKKVAGSASEYVQYQYNTKGHVSGYISQWRDAAGNLLRQNNSFTYDANNRLIKWSNEAGYGLYTYQNGRLHQSEHFAANDRKIATLRYTFDAEDRLTTVVESIADPTPGGPKQTRVSYQYHSNGNLSRIDFALRNELTDPFAVNFSKKFVQYDDKRNPEPDGVLGAFLAGVTLLFNNPLRIENILADGTVQGYTRYEYTYNAEGLPLQRKQYIAVNNTEQPPLVFTYEYD
ncbi:MAG TPA: hypothetical protein VGN63_12585 [Flavisolibacter sp.]|jgi:hypothetical protein|nr:hypothetical protein [Flavisolibacter sp.]